MRALQRQLEQMTAVMDRQARMLDLMLFGANAVAPARAPPTPPAALPSPADTITIADLWTPYLASIGAVDWRASLVSTMVKVMAHFAPSVAWEREKGRRGKLSIYGPDMLASALRPIHWDDFRAHTIATDKALGATSRNLQLKRMKTMLTWATDRELIKGNPLLKVAGERTKPKRETLLTDEYLERLLPYANVITWAFAVTICDSGMRPGEVRTLKRDQFDADGRATLSWTHTKSRKTRPAWATPRVLEALAALPVRSGNPYFFASPRKGSKKPYTKCRLWQMFRAAADKAGLEPAPGDKSVRAHDGRRSFASKLDDKDVSVNKIRVLLGHADLKTTQGYLTVKEKSLREAHQLLDTAKRKDPHPKKPPDSE